MAPPIEAPAHNPALLGKYFLYHIHDTHDLKFGVLANNSKTSKQTTHCKH